MSVLSENQYKSMLTRVVLGLGGAGIAARMGAYLVEGSEQKEMDKQCREVTHE